MQHQILMERPSTAAQQPGKGEALESIATGWMPDLSSSPRYATARAGQDLRLQMMAFVRGTQVNEHPSRLAALLEIIIALTRELCTRQSGRRRSAPRTFDRARRSTEGFRPLNPNVAQVLRSLDGIRGSLEGMESPQPWLRHALDPLLMAFLRGELSAG